MIQKANNIPLNIPNSKSCDGFRMIPKKIFNQINNILIYRKNDININNQIAIENHHNNIIKYKYYNEMFNFIQNDIYELFNKNLFWNFNMDSRVCEHKFKNGKNKGLYCGKRIDITCTDKYGKYRCCKHISTKIYKPKIKNIDPNKLCIAKTGYKDKFNCKMKKRYSCYCIHHYMEKYRFNNTELAKMFYSEIALFNDIEIELVNTNIPKSYKYNCKIIKKINIIDIYENNGYNNIKLICYNKENLENTNNLNKLSNLDNILIEKENKNEVQKKHDHDLDYILKNNIQDTRCDQVSYEINKESIKNLYKNSVDLNTNINNFKYKLKLIKEILIIIPNCSIKNCNNINNINIIKGLYCKSHAIDEFNFNNLNYL